MSAAQHKAQEKLKNRALVKADFGLASFRELDTPLHMFAGPD